MLFPRSLLAAVLTLSLFAPVSRGVDPVEEEVPAIAQIRLNGMLEEAPVANDPFSAGMENFKSKLDRIKKAKDDPAIRGLSLHIDGVGVRWGKLNELRGAIADFRKSGKKACAYLEAGSSMDYLLAIACDEVVVPESGWVMLTGLRGEVSFYKDLLDKVGVKADMLQMGDFKGAAEPMTRSKMSPQFKKQLESVLDDYYEKDLIGLIAQSRAHKQLTPEKVRKLIDEGPYTARAAAEAGLIDRVAYADAVRGYFKQSLKAERIKITKNYAKAKKEEIDSIFTLFAKVFASPKQSSSKKPKVAVIYATGVIVTGKGGESLMEDSCGSTTLIEAIRQAEEDKTVKAIVLRVDSPGGSALASDLIWNELVRCKKPVVASMSDVAASGGYYISMAAQKIYAEPGTLTGSIGVIGGKLVVGGLYDKIGVNTEVIARGANANLFSGTTPFSDSERKAMTGLMKDVYVQFLDKAIAGRAKAGKKFTRDEFTKFAEGRIWTGRQAKEHGLIDELGTLDDAVAAAKDLAKMDKDADSDLLILPKPKSFFESLFDSKSDARVPGVNGRALLKGSLPELAEHMRTLDGLLQLRGEPVWVILPCRVEVR